LEGASISVSVIRSSAEYLWRWYSYASAFGSLAEWAETAHAAAVTAHAAAVTADVLETVEAVAETDHALETVDALGLETVALAASNSPKNGIFLGISKFNNLPIFTCRVVQLQRLEGGINNFIHADNSVALWNRTAVVSWFWPNW
jgi:hypothetical protein